MKNFLKEKLKENSEGMWLSLELVKEDLDSLNLSGKVSIKVMLNAPYVSIDEIKDLLKNSSKQNNLVNLPCGQNPYNALNYNKDSVIKNSATKNSVAEGAGVAMKNNSFVLPNGHIIRWHVSRKSSLKTNPFLGQVFEVYKNEDGKWKQKCLYSHNCPTEEEAARVAVLNFSRITKTDNIEVLPEIKAKRTKKTVSEYALYVLHKGTGSAVDGSLEWYRNSINPLLKVQMGSNKGTFGDLKIKSVTDDDIMFALRKLTEHQAQSSLNKTFFVAKKVFSEAEAKGDINSNPFKFVKCPKSKKLPSEKLSIFSDEEMAALLRFSDKEDMLGELPIIYPMFAVLESTGMRPGELRGLRWDNVDFANKTVHISQAIVKEFDTIEDLNIAPQSRERVGKTKSDYSVRDIPLTDRAIESLKEWQKYLKTCPSKMKKSQFVFPDSYGSFKSKSSINSLMRRFIVRFKKAYPQFSDMEFNLYKFRHTFCTKLVLLGVPRDSIQRLMGDNNASVIQKYYTHITDKNAADMARIFYDSLNSKHKAEASDNG